MTAALLVNVCVRVEGVYKIIKNGKAIGFFFPSLIGKVMIYVYPRYIVTRGKNATRVRRRKEFSTLRCVSS